jgi:acyl-homoserine lactone acylase PvdQ
MSKEATMKTYLLPMLLMGLLLTGHGGAADPPLTILNVDGEEVVIGRDEYGVPHVFAETNKGLFTGYGYAVAQDRMPASGLAVFVEDKIIHKRRIR